MSESKQITDHTDSRSGYDIPEQVPVHDVTGAQRESIESFFDDHATEYERRGKTTAKAVIGGTKPSSGTYHADASVVSTTARGHAEEIELNGERIPFDDAWYTSSKHTYYSGVHIAGYRLTIEYHDARSGSFYRLRVAPEEDL